MLAFAADLLESLRAYARYIGERRRDAAEAQAQGKPSPLAGGQALFDNYQRSAQDAALVGQVLCLVEPREFTELSPIVNYVTRTRE